MADFMELDNKALYRRLAGRLPGRVSMPGEGGYIATTAIWPRPVGQAPRAVVHCRTREDVQLAIAAARDCDFRCLYEAEATIGPGARCAAVSSSICVE
jgi:hypothetical protein